MNGPSSADDHFLEKKNAEDNILSQFEAEKYVLKSHNESWIDKQSDGSSVFILHRLLSRRFWLFICKLKPKPAKPRDILSVTGLIS